MSVGQVSVVSVNNMQGDFSEVERLFLFIGKSANVDIRGDIVPVHAQSDLDALFGEADSDLKTQLTAARDNSRNVNWAAYAISIDPDDAEPDDWKEFVYKALDVPHDLGIEAVILCIPVTTKAEVEACQTCAMQVLTSYAKYISIHAAVSGIDSGTEAWADYLARIGALNTGVAAERVVLVPQLHGNNLGVVAGRLCDPAVTLADTPMRVATGAVIGLGDAPVDMNGDPLTMATIITMAAARFSVPQWYTGYEGMYWADHATLDVEGGDFAVYEHLRVMDHLARRVRVLTIGRIADRRLNSTAQSISANKTYFLRPLREASHTINIAGMEMPAMIQPPADTDIDLQWASQTEVKVAISAQPYKCPKKITVYLGLDLSS